MHLNEDESAAPGISPGIVQDKEMLLREMFNPHHVENGEVTPRAITLDELRSSGFSVHRMTYATAADIEKSREQRLATPRAGLPWQDAGMAKLIAGQVRACTFCGRQAFVVIDTATSTNRAHASIFAAEPNVSKAKARQLRRLLTPFLQERVTINEIFSNDSNH